MNLFIKLFQATLLGLLIFSQSGCATSEDDLGYSRKSLDTSGDTSYNGWNSVPKETSH